LFGAPNSDDFNLIILSHTKGRQLTKPEIEALLSSEDIYRLIKSDAQKIIKIDPQLEPVQNMQFMITCLDLGGSQIGDEFIRDFAKVLFPQLIHLKQLI